MSTPVKEAMCQKCLCLFYGYISSCIFESYMFSIASLLDTLVCFQSCQMIRAHVESVVPVKENGVSCELLYVGFKIEKEGQPHTST
jgi:hypothetical protein